MKPATASRRSMLRWPLLAVLPLALVGATRVPWTELVESDWVYGLATRFALVDGHTVHYPTPPSELARLLEARQESAALRHLADARLELGDRAGAMAAMERWAQAEGAQAWDEAARWAATHHEWPLAFRAAERALPSLPAGDRRLLADQRIAWAQAHPEQADPLMLLKARAEGFPDDGQALEAWIRALEQANRLQEADKALAGAKALTAERSLLMRSDLQADHGKAPEAFHILDEAVAQPWSIDFRQAYAKRVDAAAPTAPAGWRATLDRAFDAAALVRLATYFQGQQRGDAAADLLRQMDRRYESKLKRADHLLVARLAREIDAVPEAFRATLAAAHLGTPEEQQADLAVLAQLALQAGGRPLALGSYNDETYRWVARVDRTPGFWTGGIAFLLTGMPWKESLERLETEALPERTFATARALAEELARRAPRHPELAPLRVGIMARFVERGEGKEALAMLPLLESAPTAVADSGRRVALLAMRQVEVPLQEEVRLMQARLRFLAPDGSWPMPVRETYESYENKGNPQRPWARVPKAQPTDTYERVLDECLQRLEARDGSHLPSLGLILGELDRMPQAEELWLSLANRLEGWNLDDELGPRYERALERFKGPGLWPRLARWHARRSHDADLKRLAEALAQRFRASDIFSRLQGTGDLRLAIPEQPRIQGRVRMVPWADWVRFKALERFPHSPAVFNAARSLVTESQWQASFRPKDSDKHSQGPVVVPDRLMTERGWALFFLDPARRETYLGQAMRFGTLEQKLLELERRPTRTPVDDQLLFEGWSRLSRFERAFEAADRLQSAYPGDGALAQRVLSLHRSLNGLSPERHMPLARAVVQRTAPALEDASALWTELGEMEEERGRSDLAKEVWKNVLTASPRDPAKITELATLLWDYNHDAEALAVVEAGRKRIDAPTLFAFETGVLRENLKDLEGAVREYLSALRPFSGYYGGYEEDQRATRRLSQMMARDRVFRLVERRIQSLKPGVREDERTLRALFSLAGLEIPDPGQLGQDDDWIDTAELPSDPVGRNQRETAREGSRPREYQARDRITTVLLAKAGEMIPQATDREFLEAVEPWSQPLIQRRWKEDQLLGWQDTLLARRSELAPDEEDRIRQEMARADFLAGKGRVARADEVWAALSGRITALPEGVTKLRAEAARAAYLERAKGAEEAAVEWRRLTSRHPWSLGLLEDRLAFLGRVGHRDEALQLLEQILPKAGEGHRQTFLEKLTQDSLAAGDLPRAHRAVGQLLAEKGLDENHRLGALHLQARLSFREDPNWDALASTKAELGRMAPENHADLFHELARAADLEGQSGHALALWIEALNRRTDRAWLQAATRSAQKAGRAAELMGYFEKQKQRSPRDVRWAAAVRDIRRDLHQVEGAIEAARNAVAVRPEREDLWREAADLMVRGDRMRDAAEFLDGWNRPRPADESVARCRSELYARSGDPERALAVELAALEAYRQEAPKEAERLLDRRARAAERLLSLGLPAHAVRIYSPAGDITACAGQRLSERTQATLALMTGQFTKLLSQGARKDAFRSVAASVLQQIGKPEQREEAAAFVLARILPKGRQPSAEALTLWWPFVSASGIEVPVRMALARQHLASQQGPWQNEPPLAFVQAVGALRVDYDMRAGKSGGHVFRSPDLPALWMKDLARRDRPEELAAFIEPRWRELVAEVHKPTTTPSQDVLEAAKKLAASAVLGSPLPVTPPTAVQRLPWSWWMDDPEVLETWARGAARRPEKAQELTGILSERRLWDRFWGLAARGWKIEPLVALLPEPSRMAWFRLWESAPKAQDPVLIARRKVVENATSAVARLVKGELQCAEDPLIVKLRGPQTVGEVLGRSDAWIWPEFTPRRDAKGQITETGDDRITGAGADEGRLPGALWGERPGEAWYVLETLARYRKGDPSAPLVPLDAPVRGGETDRILLALQLAKGLKNLPLALALEKDHPGAMGDPRRLEQRIALLMATQGRSQAIESLRTHLEHVQPRMNEADYRWVLDLTQKHGLPSVLELLDPGTPVNPAFLAFLMDRRKDTVDRFFTVDQVGFRAALAARWAPKERQLGPEQIRYWLKELWARDAARLPKHGLARLGGLWPHTTAWLERQPIRERMEVLELLEAFHRKGSEEPALFAKLERGSDDVTALLAVRAHLLRGETEAALRRVDGLMAELHQAQELRLGSYEAVSQLIEPQNHEDAEGPETGEGEGTPPEVEAPKNGYVDSDAMVERLQRWLEPFRQHKQAQAVEVRFRKLLKERRDEGRISTQAWRLAFHLALQAELPALAKDLDAAWFRGEVDANQVGALCGVLAKTIPGETPRWLARWPQAWTYDQARHRAQILATLKQPEGAARILFEARRRVPWEASLEIQAFDLWRRLGAPAPAGAVPPTRWREAAPFWALRADALLRPLGEWLKTHPQDILAARAALREPSPGEEHALFRVGQTLEGYHFGGEDQVLLKLRAARGLLPVSWRAARRELGLHQAPEDLARMLVRRRMKMPEVNACLVDLARLAQREGNQLRLRSALALLEDRKAPGLVALRAELETPAVTAPLTYRLVNGRPTSIGPRDLTWALLAQVLKAEGVQ